MPILRAPRVGSSVGCSSCGNRGTQPPGQDEGRSYADKTWRPFQSVSEHRAGHRTTLALAQRTSTPRAPGLPPASAECPTGFQDRPPAAGSDLKKEATPGDIRLASFGCDKTPCRLPMAPQEWKL